MLIERGHQQISIFFVILIKSIMSKNYLVIGSNSAIGKEIISKLLEEGSQVFSMSRKPSGVLAEGSSIVLFSTVAVGTGMPYHASISAAKGGPGHHRWIPVNPGDLRLDRAFLKARHIKIPGDSVPISGEHFMRLLSMYQSKSHGTFIRRLTRQKAEASRDLSPF